MSRPRPLRMAAPHLLYGWLALGLTSGCVPPPTPPSSTLLSNSPAHSAHHLEMSLQNEWVQVSLLLPRGDAAPPFPVVITPIVDDALLLERGVAVARFRTNWAALAAFAPRPSPTPESMGPQIRIGQWILASQRPGDVGRPFFELITGDAEKTIPQVVDLLQAVPQVDPDRISISGSSTSGFVALQALARDPRLRTGVVRVACADYHRFLRSSFLAFHDDDRWLVDGRISLDPSYAAELRRIEPLRRATQFPSRPLLLMVGETDRAIPVQCARVTADVFADAYESAGVPERFRFIEFPGQGHDLGKDAAAEALAFWREWL